MQNPSLPHKSLRVWAAPPGQEDRKRANRDSLAGPAPAGEASGDPGGGDGHGKKVQALRGS